MNKNKIRWHWNEPVSKYREAKFRPYSFFFHPSITSIRQKHAHGLSTFLPNFHLFLFPRWNIMPHVWCSRYTIGFSFSTSQRCESLTIHRFAQPSFFRAPILRLPEWLGTYQELSLSVPRCFSPTSARKGRAINQKLVIGFAERIDGR